MSKTDKTQPWKVKAFFYPSWITDKHDHRKGYCDLPLKPTPMNIDWWRSNEACYWTFAWEALHSPLFKCGCRWCSKINWWGTNDRKHDRLAARKYCRDGWTKEY
jgi:hypothetical protein